jgi:oxygen-independent coproporphyrinogen-3 oxidase
MAVTLFDTLSRATGYRPQWGILTGVRPSKLMNRLIAQYGADGARKYFQKRLLVSPDKTALAFHVAHAEKRVMDTSRPESFSLYISIPFCPTRCSYCSFVSHSIAASKAKKLLPRYVELLCEELALTGRIASELGLRLETVYYGGGTPTTLDAEELLRLHAAVKEHFDLSTVREYTVEAGRPDTVTRERLEALKCMGATRISINPQTFSDEVLAEIGRSHTAQCAEAAFLLARAHGFSNINMDLIAGLPKDTPESFQTTLEKTLALDPESVTVHTLALKRSSTLVTRQQRSGDASLTGDMLARAQAALTTAGHFPYYMYRQSRCLGNLENVGWCRPGHEGLYNIFMMEECHTVLAAGAGAVTKLKAPHGEMIERIFNFKYPYEYNERFETLMQRKERIKQFYASYK